MYIRHISAMDFRAQDGALWGDWLFRFDAKGLCRVYDARALDSGVSALPRLAEFRLRESDGVIPHCNAVVFGTQYFADGDEFPLLYANVYNNYAKEADRREGTCCVYRLTRRGTAFSAALVQLIRIGFTDDRRLWRSAEGTEDVRPYGNFVVDREKEILYAFTMRDAEHTTRYFSFRLPRLSEGTVTAPYAVPVVTLEEEDILDYFDTEYHLYVQGACCHGGLICSSEGFNEKIPPALRVIDPAQKKQIRHLHLPDHGYTDEAEWIDFRGDTCYYSDAKGNIFLVDFDL